MGTASPRTPRSDRRSTADGEMPITPIWKETLWPLDWLSLRLSPVYYGIGVPRGDGSPVVVVPGFLGTDAWMAEMYFWLGRLGYRPYASRVGLNAECPGKITRRLLDTVRRAHDETGRPVRIVGHSLGGIIGRRVTIEHPEMVSQLIYLGSPLQSVRAHPAVMAAAAALRLAMSVADLQPADCFTDECPCGFGQDLARPLPSSVHHAAVYTRADGVLDWHGSQELDATLNHEVGGTHIGLVVNPRAYSVVAGLLAQASRRLRRVA